MPAIIDTGSSNLGVPENIYKFLKDQFYRAVSDVNCIDDDNFCFVTKQTCKEIAPRLKPIVFQINDVMFELKPNLYLHQAEDKCQFAIHQNQLKGSSSGLFLIGDIMLRHLYQVYDFENETISLGVNTHSKDEILMYDKGMRPDEAPKL